MQVIAEKSWAWMLYEHEGEFILSVLCGSVAIYGREILLNAEEKADYLERGQASIEELARSIFNDPAAFQDRQIRDFHKREDISQAVKAWRSRQKA